MTPPTPVTRWKADDGSFHESEAAAAAHDAEVASRAAELADLWRGIEGLPARGATPEIRAWHLRFEDGNDYLQQSAAQLEVARAKFVALLRKHHPSFLCANGAINQEFVGRALCDNDSWLYGPFMRLFRCMDDSAREWVQPYAAIRAGSEKWRATR